jgi:hypothetical protein
LALAEPSLEPDFRAALQAPDRGDGQQAFIDCVLTILEEGKAPEGLRVEVYAVIVDTTRWPRNRERALHAWLALGAKDHEAHALLDDVSAGRISDPDDALAGNLLTYLYPRAISAVTLMTYWHEPKNPDFWSDYRDFWSRRVAANIPDSDLTLLLDQIVSMWANAPPSYGNHPHELQKLVDSLFAKAIRVHGDTLTPKQYVPWLGTRGPGASGSY